MQFFLDNNLYDSFRTATAMNGFTLKSLSVDLNKIDLMKK